MIGNILAIVGYGRAPKKTFMLRHPIKSLRAKRARRNVKDLVRRPRFAVTLGAAAAAVPVGIWIGNRLRAR